MGTQEFFSEDAHERVFEKQLWAESSKTMANKQFLFLLKKLYMVPSYTSEILQICLGDVPVASLKSFGLLVEDEQGKVHDALDKKAEMALKKIS